MPRPQGRPEAEAASPSPRAGPTDRVGQAAFDPGRARRKLLTTAAVVLVLVGAAHVGLYLLLTRDARASMAEIESRHDVAALEGARPPEGEPAPGSPAYRPWREAKALWVDAQAWRTDKRQVTLLEGGVILSFVVQVAITAWVLLRLLGGVRHRARDLG